MTETCIPLLVANAVPGSWVLSCDTGVKTGEKSMHGIEKGI